MEESDEISDIANVVQRLYSCEPRTIFSISVTGGGVNLVPMLCTVPGASRSLMDLQIPYVRSALQIQLLSVDNKREMCGVNVETAVEMALISRRRAASLLLSDTHDFRQILSSSIIGLSCTAALISAQPKRGCHRMHAACASANGVRTYSLTLNKALTRTRREEDDLCSRVLLDALLNNLSFSSEDNENLVSVSKFASKLIKEDEIIFETALPCADSLENFYAGKTKKVFMQLKIKSNQPSSTDNNATLSLDDFECWEDLILPEGSLIYPGSFRPMHRGHAQLALAALESEVKRCTQASAIVENASPCLPPLIVFEISAKNADKPPLSRADVLQRARALLASLPAYGIENAAVCITFEPLFVGKAALFRGCTFVLGADTLTRILDVKYYGQQEKNAMLATRLAGCDLSETQLVQQARFGELVAALASIHANSVRFVVGGREVIENGHSHFLSCAEILASSRCALIPKHLLQGLFSGLDEAQFRVDLSSTMIRQVMDEKQ